MLRVAETADAEMTTASFPGWSAAPCGLCGRLRELARREAKVRTTVFEQRGHARSRYAANRVQKLPGARQLESVGRIADCET